MEIQVDHNAVLNVKVLGQGKLVVMLPAIARPADDYDLLAAYLSNSGYRTAVVNPRGIRGSTGSTDNLTLESMALDTARVIETLGGGPAHLIGHCSGGRVVRLLADIRPDLAASSIPLTAGGLVPAQCDIFPVWDMIASRDPLDPELQDLIRLFFSEGSDPSSWYFDWIGSMVRKHVLAFVASPMEQWLCGGRAPMLIVQGEEDRVAPVANGHLTAERIGERARVVDIPDAGHQILAEQPARVAAGILEFLKGVDNGGDTETRISVPVSGNAPENPPPKEEDEETGEDYGLGWGPAVTRYQSNRSAERFADFFIEHLKPGMGIIDCGCGPGSLSMDFARIVDPGDVTGIDIQPKQIAYARHTAETAGINNLCFDVGDIYNLPFPENSFDGAWMCTVLMNLSHPQKALEEVYRVLKPGGVIGVSDGDWGGDIMVPTFQAIQVLHENFENGLKSSGADYRRGRYNRALLNGVGFENVSASAMVECYGSPEETRPYADLCVRRIEDSFQGDPLAKEACITSYRAWGRHPDAFFARVRCQALGWKGLKQ